MEVIQHGAESPRRARAPWIVAGAVVVLGAVITWVAIGASGDPLTPGVNSVAFIAADDIDPAATNADWEQGLGMPAGAVLPGARVALEVTGGPRSPSTVITASSSGAVRLEPAGPFTLPAGETTTIEISLGPTDCAAISLPAGLDEAGYRWRRAAGVQLLEDVNGVPVDVSDNAKLELAAILRDLCAPAGEAPSITMVDAKLDGPWREQVLDIRAQISSSADRVLADPLDGPGLRGIGSFKRPTDPDFTLMWAVSPLGEDTDGLLDAYVRILTVVDGTAYPWIERIVPPASIDVSTPLRQAPERSLADAAPRPSS